MTEHEHDWRVDPYRILPSNPPRLKHVCATCGAEKSGPLIGEDVHPEQVTGNPLTWPKADPNVLTCGDVHPQEDVYHPEGHPRP